MFTPQLDTLDMPELVDRDGNPPFYPPPRGAADGGQPGIYDSFPGARSNPNFQASTSWGPPGATPYAAPGQWSISSGPSSAPGWYPGGYPPSGTPVWGTGASGWAPQTPHTPNAAPYPTGYPSPYAAAQPYNPPTPFFTGQPPPGTPYESVSAQPGGVWGWDPSHQQQSVPYAVKRSRRRSGEGLVHVQSLKRVNSQGRPPRRPTLQRSSSWGNAGYTGNGNMPAYARGDLYDEQNLARRPRDWRPDYTPAGKGLQSILPSLLRPKSDVMEWTDFERRETHPLLLYRSNYPPIYYDLREPVFRGDEVEFLTLDRPQNEIDFAQLAFQPGFKFIRLFHPRLPWYVDIHQSHPNGVTILDVFVQLTAQLLQPIHGRHYWNEDLSSQDRMAIAAAFQDRCKDHLGVVQRGVLQVDFLGEKSIFQGLSRGPKGMWEIKTCRPEP